MARYTTKEQIQEIVSTDLYKSGKSFTISQIIELCTTINYPSRMNELLRMLMDDGFVQSSGAQLNLTYRRSGDKWLRKRWVSEVAQGVCSAEIMSETSREKRLLMLEKVPDHFQALVKRHVEIAYESKQRLRKASRSRDRLGR
jgi:hypothetical protein